MALDDVAGWEFSSRGEGWAAGGTALPGRRGPAAALVIRYPGRTESAAGDFGALSRTVPRPAPGELRLRFTVQDSFDGPTAGYHFAQVLVGGEVLWEADVAGSMGVEPITVPIPTGADPIAVTLRVFERRAVTNFGVQVAFAGVRLEAADGRGVDLVPPLATPAAAPLPPDPALPTAPPSSAAWLREAVVLQPWGRTQQLAFTDVGDRPQRLRAEFGFNALIVLPPEAHNAIQRGRGGLTDDQFRAALEVYRAAGYRIILYSSVMHCGHAPEWQSGDLSRAHPDWVQRDPQGGTLEQYGAPWLCPSTPARDYTLAYTERIARAYQADGVMLDNNQFMSTAAGWTCHCDSCQRGFAGYVRARFSDAEVRDTFGLEPDAVRIPSEQDGPLHALWLHWRERVWAETNEQFRTRLRGIRPDFLFFANTQYLYSSAVLAVDQQYEHEDVVLSESRSADSRGMALKMLLGQALAAGRPLWNYIGTFDEEDFTQLRPASEVGPIIAASLAHGARPWIVYYGFQDGQESAAREEMSDLLNWYTAQQELYAAPRWAPVGVVVSTRARDLFARPLIPPHLDALLRAGVPVRAVREGDLNAETLAPLRALTVETAACLDDAAADAVAAWVRGGGILVANPEVGCFDELGRLRQRSALPTALGLDSLPAEPIPVGRGRVVCPEPARFTATAIAEVAPWTIGGDPAVEVVPYRDGDQVSLHLIRHEPFAGRLTLRLPAGLWPDGTEAEQLSPYLDGARPVSIARDGELTVLTIGQVPIYSVVRGRD